jgi:DNA-binding transcriptional LysR family regulator
MSAIGIIIGTDSISEKVEHMNILQMKYFLTAAACLNFTQAANLLYISQPALSRQISTIEEELEVTLFTRTNRSVELTECGKFLRDELQKVYDHYARTVAKAKNIERVFPGS